MLDRTWWLLVKSVGVVLPRDDEVATLHVHDVTFRACVRGLYFLYLEATYVPGPQLLLYYRLLERVQL